MTEYVEERQRLPLFVHIAVGVCLGLLIAEFIGWKFWQFELAAQAEAARAQVAKAAAEQAVRDQVIAAQRRAADAARTAAAATAERVDEAHRAAESAEQQRHEQAWARYYQKPARCQITWDVECGNDFIRAKRRFEELYAAGKL